MEHSEDMNPGKKILLAAKTFKELVLESDVFVDKSFFIEKVINFKSTSIVITRPRRWGKSLNLDMLKTFLEFSPNKEELEENRKLFEGEDVCKESTNKIESEENKELVEDKQFSTNQIEEKKNLFEDESALHLAKKKQLKPLKISKHKSEEFYQNNIGKYAVICLYFNNANASSENFEEILRNVVQTACKPYKYLYQQYITKKFETFNSVDLVDSFEKFKKYLKGDKTININNFLEFIVFPRIFKFEILYPSR